MSTVHLRRSERRRTPRVAIFANLTIEGSTDGNEKFKVHTHTLSVSGHGGLTILETTVVVGQILLLTNEKSRQKTECRVVSLRPRLDGKTFVAFEFVSPSVNFWKMSFPVLGTKPLRRAVLQ